MKNRQRRELGLERREVRLKPLAAEPVLRHHRRRDLVLQRRDRGPRDCRNGRSGCH